MPEPIQVYPDPDGGTAKNTVPVDGGTTTAGTASGAIATASLLLGAGDTVTAGFGFLQSAAYDTTASGGRLVTAIPLTYVAVAIFFGALSVLLWTLALVRGYRMKQRALKISEEVCQLCADHGILKKHGYKTPAANGTVPVEA